MSNFKIYHDVDNRTTTISNIFIDDYLSDANDAQIKVYLYLIRMIKAGRTSSINDIANKFNHTEKEVCRALSYWENKGLLSLEHNSSGFIAGIRLFEPVPIESHSFNNTMKCSISNEFDNNSYVDDTRTNAMSSGNSSSDSYKRAYSSIDIKNFKQNEDSSQLIYLAENYLKRTLTVNDIKSLLFYFDDLHFNVDLIDFLLQFCVERGKASFSYIDKVAIDWSEHGIHSVHDARAYACGKISREKSDKGSKKSSSSFHQIEQNSYDFNAIEAVLLNQNMG